MKKFEVTKLEAIFFGRLFSIGLMILWIPAILVSSFARSEKGFELFWGIALIGIAVPIFVGQQIKKKYVNCSHSVKVDDIKLILFLKKAEIAERFTKDFISFEITFLGPSNIMLFENQVKLDIGTMPPNKSFAIYKYIKETQDGYSRSNIRSLLGWFNIC